MKKHTLTFLLLFSLTETFSQVFWIETFGIGCNQLQVANGFPGSTGLWVVNYLSAYIPTANTDEFYVSATEAGMPIGGCSNGCLLTPTLTNRSLHISVSTSTNTFFCPTGDCGGIYNASQFSDLRAESPAINCTGKSGISLRFDYMENGDGILDDGSVYYSVALGPWTFLGNPIKTPCDNSACTGTAACTGLNVGIWSTYTINLPVTVNNTANLRLGFRWVNNGDNIGTDPSFVIDNINVLTGGIAAVEKVIFDGNEFKVYPNPANDKVNIELNAGRTTGIEIQMTDILGKIIIAEKPVFNSENRCVLNTSTVMPGIYFIRIKSDNKQSTPIKIIKE